jgi:hypothetical protein
MNHPSTYVGAAYWFTSSTSFANPAVTIGRVQRHVRRHRPDSLPGFVASKVLGAAIVTGLLVGHAGLRTLAPTR